MTGIYKINIYTFHFGIVWFYINNVSYNEINLILVILINYAALAFVMLSLMLEDTE